MGSNVLKLFSLLLCSSLISCATVKHGTMQPVPIKTDPPNAEVRVNGVSMGRTPTTLNLSRTSAGTGTIRVDLDGYRSEEIVVRRYLSGAFWGNLLIGGIIGMGVDFISGAWANLDPKEINLALSKLPDPPGASTAATATPQPRALAPLVPISQAVAREGIDTKSKPSCTTSQILSLKSTGINDLQIKAACGD